MMRAILSVALLLGLLVRGHADMPPAVNAESSTLYSTVPIMSVQGVLITGTPTPGASVGFDYAFAHGGVNYLEHIRYTTQPGDDTAKVTAGLSAALLANTNWSNAVIAEGCNTNRLSAGPYYGQPLSVLNNLIWDRCWPMDANSTVTVVSSPGLTMVAVNGGNTLEAFPFYGCMHDLVPGRPVQNDGMCSFFVLGPDTSGGPYPYVISGDNKRGFPYFYCVPIILNPTFGSWDAELWCQFALSDSITFGKNRIEMNGVNVADVKAPTPYNVTVSCGNGGALGSYTVKGRHKTWNGQVTKLWIDLSITNNGSCGSWLQISLPRPASADVRQTMQGREDAKTGAALMGWIDVGGQFLFVATGAIPPAIPQYPGCNGCAIVLVGEFW